MKQEQEPEQERLSDQRPRMTKVSLSAARAPLSFTGAARLHLLLACVLPSAPDWRRTWRGVRARSIRRLSSALLSDSTLSRVGPAADAHALQSGGSGNCSC